MVDIWLIYGFGFPPTLCVDPPMSNLTWIWVHWSSLIHAHSIVGLSNEWCTWPQCVAILLGKNDKPVDGMGWSIFRQTRGAKKISGYDGCRKIPHRMGMQTEFQEKKYHLIDTYRDRWSQMAIQTKCGQFANAQPNLFWKMGFRSKALMSRSNEKMEASNFGVPHYNPTCTMKSKILRSSK